MYRLTAEFDVSGQVGPKQIARVDILHSEDGDLAKSVFHKLLDIPEDERGFIFLIVCRRCASESDPYLLPDEDAP